MQNYINYKDKKIEYSVTYRNRKSVGISVSLKDGVRVSAPRWVGKKQIQDIVNLKSEWIYKKLEELTGRQPDTVKKELVDESELLFWGRVLYLKTVNSPSVKRASVRMAADMIIVTLPFGLQSEEREGKIRKLLLEWYRERALEALEERVQYFAGLMGVKPSNIRVKQQKTRWGSCSSRGNINFNWKLVMFPVDIMDYVVVHELAHLKVMNHSTSFWNLVASIMPDYKTRTKQLKEYARKLDFPE